MQAASAPIVCRTGRRPSSPSLRLERRVLGDDVRDCVRRLLAGGFGDIRAHLEAVDLAGALAPPAGGGLDALLDDVATLARRYLAVAEVPAVELRLERVVDDACRAFHRDAVRLRLITTYAGPGADFVADADASTALRLQAAFSGAVSRAPAGALAWMRGSVSTEGPGAVHRSPRIEGTGAIRLVLAISEAAAGSPARWSPTVGPLMAAALAA